MGGGINEDEDDEEGEEDEEDEEGEEAPVGPPLSRNPDFLFTFHLEMKTGFLGFQRLL